MQQHPARWMLWEAEPQAETVERLKGLLVESVVYSTCANVPEVGDFMSVMTENLGNLETAFLAFGIR